MSPRHRARLSRLRAMATVHPPPQLALLPTTSRPLHHRAGNAASAAVLDGIMVDDGVDSDGESVAESCPWPAGDAAAAATDDSCGGSTCCHDHGEEEMEDDDDDDDGCGSCVEGDECSSYRYQELHDEEEGGAEPARSGVWWEQVAATGGGGCAIPLPPPASSQEEDPKRAAERQEEDRKFWEDCLASGYP